MKHIFSISGAGVVICLVFIQTCFAEQTIVAKKVDKAPVIDGQIDDAVWAQTQEIITHDKVADIDISMKAVYTDTNLFFLVSYPDPEASVTHKTWKWDEKEEIYVEGNNREDVFVFKWNMESHPVDLSIMATEEHVADIWFWKANRTDPMGYADDKIHRLSREVLNDAMKIEHKSGKTMYLQRKGDVGKEAYKQTIYVDYQGDALPKYSGQIPEHSRADIKAKGHWSDGKWTIEFGRALATGYQDDLEFEISGEYQFGVSRYEIAGRELAPGLNQPLYGSGDVSEKLTLRFETEKNP